VKEMKNVSKTAILPILSVIALVIGTLTGHQFSKYTIDEAATILAVGITAGINIWGIIKNHKKEVK
jgi:presenilin-like A22 family membrane protease